MNEYYFPILDYKTNTGDDSVERNAHQSSRLVFPLQISTLEPISKKLTLQ